MFTVLDVVAAQAKVGNAGVDGEGSRDAPEVGHGNPLAAVRFELGQYLGALTFAAGASFEFGLCGVHFMLTIGRRNS